MFVYDFIEVQQSFVDLRAKVLADGSSWLVPHASAIYAETERGPVALGRMGESSVPGQVTLELGPPREHRDRLIVPLVLRAAGSSALLPKLDADLVFAPLAADSTHVSLLGSYDPPLGALGRGLDRLVLHRLAEAGIRRFLRRVAAALEAATPPVSPTPR